jgi:hypothetical protein
MVETKATVEDMMLAISEVMQELRRDWHIANFPNAEPGYDDKWQIYSAFDLQTMEGFDYEASGETLTEALENMLKKLRGEEQ